jgi:Rrf2 family protein
MPVTLGKHGDYAVRAAIDLARHYEDGPRKAREVAASMDIPPDFLKRILAELVSQGLLTSTAGPNGGYHLTRPPGDITLLDVVEPAERFLSPDQCILRGGPCDWADACPIHDPWCLAQKAFAESLNTTNLAQLARIDHDIEHTTHIPINPTHANPTVRRGTRT